MNLLKVFWELVLKLLRCVNNIFALCPLLLEGKFPSLQNIHVESDTSCQRRLKFLALAFSCDSCKLH